MNLRLLIPNGQYSADGKYPVFNGIDVFVDKWNQDNLAKLGVPMPPNYLNHLENKKEQAEQANELHNRNITTRILNIIVDHKLLDNKSTAVIARELLDLITDYEILEAA